MKDRYLINVYKIEDVPELKDGGRDNIVEQTEDSLNKSRDFQFQLQGDSLIKVACSLLDSAIRRLK
jgi:hypothetical protein